MIWLIVFVVMLLFVGAMAIGVMNGRKPLAGSCGGIAALGLEKKCGFCGGEHDKCKRNTDKTAP
jgi:hypothetical protein